MAFPRRLLGTEESVVEDLHPHWKALVLPGLLVPVVVGLASYGVAVMPAGRWQPPGRYAVLAVAVAVLLRGSLWPFLRWRTTGYTFTDRRLIVRQGVLSRSGRDVPLDRVNDVTFSHRLVERLLGCGTLVVESGGERGQLVLSDVPRVEEMQREVYRLVEANDLRRRRWGDDPDELRPAAGDFPRS